MEINSTLTSRHNLSHVTSHSPSRHTPPRDSSRFTLPSSLTRRHTLPHATTYHQLTLAVNISCIVEVLVELIFDNLGFAVRVDEAFVVLGRVARASSLLASLGERAEG